MGVRVTPLDGALGTTTDEPGGPAAQPVAGVDRLRRHLDRLKGDQARVFDIPGYGGDVVARYRRLTPEETTANLHDAPGDVWERNAQYLIAACTHIGEPVRQEGKPTEVNRIDGAVMDGWGGIGPLIGDQETIGEMAVTDMVLAVFAGDQRALCDHAADVERWMQTVNDQIDQEFAGGS